MFFKWDRMKENCLNNPTLTPSIEKYPDGVEKVGKIGGYNSKEEKSKVTITDAN